MQWMRPAVYWVGEADSNTADHPLLGAAGFRPDEWKQLGENYGFDEAIARHLQHNYGSQASRVGELAKIQPELARRLHPDFPFIAAEVVYAVREEMACTLRDFLARRIRLEIMDWEAVQQIIPVVAELMARELNWAAATKMEAERSYFALMQDFRNRLFSKISTNHVDKN